MCLVHLSILIFAFEDCWGLGGVVVLFVTFFFLLCFTLFPLLFVVDLLLRKRVSEWPVNKTLSNAQSRK